MSVIEDSWLEPVGLLRFFKLYSSLVLPTFFRALSSLPKSSLVFKDLTPGRIELHAQAFKPGRVPIPALRIVPENFNNVANSKMNAS